MPDTPEPPRTDPADRIADAVTESGELLAEAVRPAVDSVRPIVERVRRGAGRRFARRLRRRHRDPLPNLYEVDPSARDAPIRETGLVTIPVAEIVGTAVEGPAQRGSDFKPLGPFRSANWNGRWRRLLAATERLEILPPIDVLKTADGYWITDGHNRVAAALAIGQREIDAVVRTVVRPGTPIAEPTGSLAAVLAEADQVVAAGKGLLTPGATLGTEGVSHAGGDPDDGEPRRHHPHPGELAAGEAEELG